MQNISDDLLDGGVELHHLTGNAGDRAGSLDDDEQRAGGAVRGACARAPRTAVWGRVGCPGLWDDLPRDWAAQMDA
eukprot:4430020-Prymnesium_polylepis.1